MQEPARILIIRFSSIGDIILTSPVIRILSQQLPGGAEIHFLTKQDFAPLVANLPGVFRVHTIERTVQEVLPELETIGFDYIVDLHRNFRSAIIKRRLKCLAFTFRKLNFRKWLWVNFGWNTMPHLHVVDRYLETLRLFLVVDDGLGLDFIIPPSEKLEEEEVPLSHRQGYYAFVIGGVHLGKRMDVAKVAEIVRAAGHPVAIMGGPENLEEGEDLAARCGDLVWNTCGHFSIHGSAAVARRSAFVVTGDTGMMHIASALCKPIISLWGCTVPGFGMAPFRPHPSSVVLEPLQLKRRPCSKLGNRCKYGMKNRCIQQLDNRQITGAIETLWAQQTKP